MIHSTAFTLDQFAPIAVYDKLKTYFPNEISFLFESAGTSEGNYSFIAIGAQERLVFKDNITKYTDNTSCCTVIKEDPFTFLKNYYNKLDQKAYRAKTLELGIGYVDGFIGYIGYDMVKVFEPILQDTMDSLKDELETPDLDLIRPKLILVYSHKTHKLTLVSSMDEIKEKFSKIEDELKSSYNYIPLKPIDSSTEGSFSFSKEKFFNMVNESKEMIKSGDVFQILIANRYTAKAEVDPFSFYRILRTKNPSPYMFLLEFEDFSIVGSSPEVMVRLQDGELLLKPIAGTRKRGTTLAKDIQMEEELTSDPKECAEHLMLIDLGRNDVSRVAKTGSVQVHDMMHVEKYSHVMHMVTDVIAELRDDKDMFDLFAATFTAGTMTGAPKIRAMQLIAQYEEIKRGFYAGAIGYFGFDGNMDSAITIRTSLIKKDYIVFQAGAGVVADSVCELEYLEVKNKLAALLSSLDDLKA
ncbi:chorismate-binding protein [Sulfurimonas sp. MAG313]|nr:chorismate-binding protein [Sulfurimonas sp. MAG313]MDF1881346.1 chorismate-binding protein [Sulfurimonas sp. MAG313]